MSSASRPTRQYGGKTVYLTGQAVTNYLRKISKKIYPHMTEEELSYYSCHSFRVWAAVLLSEAGKNGDYIKIRLRWCSKSYRVYLRDMLNSAAATRWMQIQETYFMH
jgi:hypothetical protein